MREVPERHGDEQTKRKSPKASARNRSAGNGSRKPSRRGSHAAHTAAAMCISRIPTASIGWMSASPRRTLAEYYVAVWDWMAPHVVGRPLALVRCPDGTKGQCFFQKHASAGISDQAFAPVVNRRQRARTSSRSMISRAWCRWCRPACWRFTCAARRMDKPGALRPHRVRSRSGRGRRLAHIVAAAREVRERLEELEARKLRQALRRQGAARRAADRRRRLGYDEEFCPEDRDGDGGRQPRSATSPR